MRRPDNSLPASHTLAIAGTGGGKTTWIRNNRLPAAERRVIVWDGKDEYDGFGFERITSRRALALRLQSAQAGRIAYATTCTRDEFAFWSRAVWAWGHCLCLAEELSDVTSPAKAPPAWGELIRKGRAHGVRTISTTQRPQEIDKTIIGNATDAMVGFQSLGNDRAYVADRLGFQRADLDSLNPGEYLYSRFPVSSPERGSIAQKSPAKQRRKGAKPRNGKRR